MAKPRKLHFTLPFLTLWKKGFDWCSYNCDWWPTGLEKIQIRQVCWGVILIWLDTVQKCSTTKNMKTYLIQFFCKGSRHFTSIWLAKDIKWHFLRKEKNTVTWPTRRELYQICQAFSVTFFSVTLNLGWSFKKAVIKTVKSLAISLIFWA